MVDRGKVIIVGILLFSAAAAGFGVWYRYQASRRSLELWGAEHASRIKNAEHVVAWRVTPSDDGAETAPDGSRVDFGPQRELQAVRDTAHIRKVFVDDVHFNWNASDDACAPNWAYVLQFQSDAQQSTLWIDDQCNVVRLAETEAVGRMNPPLLRSVRSFLARYVAEK